uniref:Non-structural protein 2 n=1 Tax=Maypo virus TaxID=2776959 RepID=A0A8E4QJ86_9REOV|nr:MAG: non-structural protein 2 [Maypo virus]
MAELACFVSLSSQPQDADAVVTFSPFTSKAVKASMTYKYDKSEADKCIDTVFFGLAPPPKYRKRFAREDGRGIKLGKTYDEVCKFVASTLNKCNIKSSHAKAVLDKIGSVRYLESIYRRSLDEDDVMSQDELVQKRSVGICFGLTKEKESTVTTESNEVVFANAALTVTMVRYTQYEMTENKHDEYKITLNALQNQPTDQQIRDVQVFCLYNLNRYMIIHHGKGHWRVVPHTTVLQHIERMFHTYQITKVFTQEEQLSHKSWAKAMDEMVRGAPLQRMKDEALSRSNISNKTVKRAVQDHVIEEMSVVGAS